MTSDKKRWARRPPGSNWGDFGEDDELGRLNLITPNVVRAAVAEVRAGLSFCLSLPLTYPGGSVLARRRKPPQLQPLKTEDGAYYYNFPIAHLKPGHTDVISDEAVVLHTQYSTQWDGFAHVGHMFDADGDGLAEGRYYNGFRADFHIFSPLDDTGKGMGAKNLSVDTMAVKAIQSRGVLVDLCTGHGRPRRMVGYEDLMRAMEHQNAAVSTGDILCLYTGFADLVLAMGGEPDAEVLHGSCAVLDGRDEALLGWISDSGIAALAADNYAVESIPSTQGETPCASLPLHELCLFKQGIPLGELWYLGELAAWLRSNGRNRFLLTAPPLRLPGAVGSPVTPVATV